MMGSKDLDLSRPTTKIECKGAMVVCVLGKYPDRNSALALECRCVKKNNGDRSIPKCIIVWEFNWEAVIIEVCYHQPQSKPRRNGGGWRWWWLCRWL